MSENEAQPLERYTEKEAHKRFAIDLNNLTWTLLGKKERTAEEDEKMVNAAHASTYHWGEVGTAVNQARGQWMISHSYAVLNRPQSALHHAQLCLLIVEQNNFGDFDLAYAYEGMARALAASEQLEEARRYYALAEEAGQQIKDKEDRDIFAGDFEEGPWYGLK
ncbi:MAG TPA: hypothetical protein VH186_29250 [Chloroflexia bacterium]|nr:hypothetical protein [Chloroflexia bacterium]